MRRLWGVVKFGKFINFEKKFFYREVLNFVYRCEVSQKEIFCLTILSTN